MCWFFLLRGEQVANPCIIYVLGQTKKPMFATVQRQVIVLFDLFYALSSSSGDTVTGKVAKIVFVPVVGQTRDIGVSGGSRIFGFQGQGVRL